MSLATTLLGVASAHAEQFVAADVTYTHSAMHTDSHNRVNPTPETPASWTSPVNYAGGSAHVRLEVRTKPNTTTPTCFQVCFEAATNYGCTDISMPYTNVGVYEWDTPFSRFYTPGAVSWNTGVRRVALILKDTMNGKPSPDNVPAATSALYMPTDLRVTVTIVSAGSTYQPPAGSAGDGGAGAARDAARAEASVTNPRDGAAVDSSRPTDSGSSVSEAASPTPERPPVMEAAAPTPTTPPATGQPGGSGGSAGAGGGAAAGAGGASPSPTPSTAPPSPPTPPSEPEGGGSCSVGRFAGSSPSSKMTTILAGAVALAVAASRRRRVIAPRAMRKACP